MSVVNNWVVKMKKALIYTSVASMVEQFMQDNIRLLQDMGYQVEVACNFEEGNTIDDKKILNFKESLTKKGVTYHQLPIPRDLKSLGKMKTAYNLSKRLFQETYYDLIHFHSPIGAAIGRFAARQTRKKGTRVIYTAHGFHFFSGAPIFNWAIFYPLEYLMSKYTDTLITINKQDYQRAQNLLTEDVQYTPGVGIDTKKLGHSVLINKSSKRREFGVLDSEVLLLSVGELNPNKNHKELIKQLPKIEAPFKYLICGQGHLEEELKALCSELNVADKVTFLGYRTDVPEIMQASDVFLFPSKREGLSVALMEAMATGLPCLVSDIRGNTDLIDQNKGGFIFKHGDAASILESMKKLVGDELLRERMSQYNLQKIKTFDKNEVNVIMREIYTI